MSCSWDYCLQIQLAGMTAAGLGGAQLLELPTTIGRADCPALALLDSGPTHCFLSEQITLLAGLDLDTSARLEVHLPDGEPWACLGVAHKDCITLARRIVQYWDFWIVPLA